MKFHEKPFTGVYEIEGYNAADARGIFVKIFNKDSFESKGLATGFCENYYSVSKKDVIRGMHFQLPPFSHCKLVYVTEGEILDVIIDLRRKSKTFGRFLSLNLKALGNAVYIPEGFAHGFLTLSPSATVLYQVTSVHEPSADSGIRWDSFGFEWPVSSPVLSDRDQSFISFTEFQSPF